MVRKYDVAVTMTALDHCPYSRSVQFFGCLAARFIVTTTWQVALWIAITVEISFFCCEVYYWRATIEYWGSEYTNNATPSCKAIATRVRERGQQRQAQGG